MVVLSSWEWNLVNLTLNRMSGKLSKSHLITIHGNWAGKKTHRVSSLFQWFLFIFGWFNKKHAAIDSVFSIILLFSLTDTCNETYKLCNHSMIQLQLLNMGKMYKWTTMVSVDIVLWWTQKGAEHSNSMDIGCWTK